MSNVLQQYTELDRKIREQERSVSEVEAHINALDAQETEIYKRLKVKDWTQFESQFKQLQSAVSEGLTVWESKAIAVESAVRKVQSEISSVQ